LLFYLQTESQTHSRTHVYVNAALLVHYIGITVRLWCCTDRLAVILREVKLFCFVVWVLALASSVCWLQLEWHASAATDCQPLELCLLATRFISYS